MKSARKKGYGPRPLHPFKRLLLGLTVRSGGELSPASFIESLEQQGVRLKSVERQRHNAHMRLERDFYSLTKEGSGSLRGVTHRRGYSGKVFHVNDLGRLRNAFQMIESIFKVSDETDQKEILQSVLIATKLLAATSASYQTNHVGDSVESWLGEQPAIQQVI